MIESPEVEQLKQRGRVAHEARVRNDTSIIMLDTDRDLSFQSMTDAQLEALVRSPGFNGGSRLATALGKLVLN